MRQGVTRNGKIKTVLNMRIGQTFAFTFIRIQLSNIPLDKAIGVNVGGRHTWNKIIQVSANENYYRCFKGNTRRLVILNCREINRTHSKDIPNMDSRTL